MLFLWTRLINRKCSELEILFSLLRTSHRGLGDHLDFLKPRKNEVLIPNCSVMNYGIQLSVVVLIFSPKDYK